MTGVRAVAVLSTCLTALAIAAPGGTGSTRPAAGRATAPAYRAPLPEPIEVLRPFDPPATDYGPGHLGVDLRATRAAIVRAAADGVVSFAGQVAGRGVVVVGHPDGIRTEYEPVQPLVRVGAHLRAGDPVGELRGRHQGCPGPCLHWGARRGDNYLDPLTLLRPLGPVVLLPNR